ncbi:recombinase family protein [Dactylosporangium aurantiacum]|uniref:Recombinase family protein n=1 Tax=Dactylosporangium aurantiacum TaxID=35754 RepID=A0A9Q9MIU0_9ACTN|nr:recombinase family protein [Dactylosporangium aurantiacum]MDG6105450.1 recombinase family protein [Dactylosporangium aurantiacum]UWZ54011.1 recombinase family protein [Dactylosporangium aurantiacum]
MISYARISSDGERDEHGVSDQHRVNRRTAQRLGLRVVAELTDNDRSASKAGVVRESFEAMLKALESGRLPDGTAVCGVVVLNEDRLARRAGDYERFVESLTAEDGRVFADERGRKDLYAEDVEGLGLVGVAFSRIEARKVRRRMKRFHRARAEDGKPAGGTRPFGWAEDRLSLDPIEAPLLAKAAKDFAAGRSLNSIIREWQRDGVRTSLGNEWSSRSLRVTLANARICGWRSLHGEIVTDDEGQPIVGKWEPIVDPATWQAIDAIVRMRKGRSVGPDGQPGNVLAVDFSEHRYLLSGIVRCGKAKADGSPCNGPLRARRFRGNEEMFHYVCQPKSQGGCAGICRHGPKTDEYVSEMVLAKLEEREMQAPRTEAWGGSEELETVQGQLDDLGREWRSGGISNEFFFANVRQLEGRMTQLRAEQGRHAAAAKRRVVGVESIRRRWYLAEADGGLDISQKRAYIREALHAVLVLPAGRGRAAYDPNLLQPFWRNE